MKIKTVFFGTHDFAATILKGLLDSPIFEVTLVISRPDEPVGRKQIIEKTPVKKLAEEYGIVVEQPDSLKNYELLAFGYELGITAQYGGLIPKHILDAPEKGILNVHTSLLPKYRGASPIQSAIMNGDTETGVTIMKMDEGLDTGPILLQKILPIEADETALQLEAKLAALGVATLLEAATRYISGELTPTVQTGEVTTCKKLTRDTGKIDWNKNANDTYNQFRALQPWPGVWTEWHGKRIKLHGIKKNAETQAAGLVKYTPDGIVVGCGIGSILIIKLQLEGKNSLDAKKFALGYSAMDGSTLS